MWEHSSSRNTPVTTLTNNKAEGMIHTCLEKPVGGTPITAGAAHFIMTSVKDFIRVPPRSFFSYVKYEYRRNCHCMASVPVVWLQKTM